MRKFYHIIKDISIYVKNTTIEGSGIKMETFLLIVAFIEVCILSIVGLIYLNFIIFVNGTISSFFLIIVGDIAFIYGVVSWFPSILESLG